MQSGFFWRETFNKRWDRMLSFVNSQNDLWRGCQRIWKMFKLKTRKTHSQQGTSYFAPRKENYGFDYILLKIPASLTEYTLKKTRFLFCWGRAFGSCDRRGFVLFRFLLLREVLFLCFRKNSRKRCLLVIEFFEKVLHKIGSHPLCMKARGTPLRKHRLLLLPEVLKFLKKESSLLHKNERGKSPPLSLLIHCV